MPNKLTPPGKPCPFCGSQDLYRWITDVYRAVGCSNCRAVGPKKSTNEEADEAWEDRDDD